MRTYKYADGALESIETPELLPELTWGPVGHPCPRDGEDYAWYCGLPCEGLSAGLAEGFTISLYRAVTDRPPYPYLALVDLGGDSPDEIHFSELRDVIAYVREHAPLLQLTVLAAIADRIEETMKWLFDSESGLFRDHVHEVNYRAHKAAEARRRARNAMPVGGGRTPPA